MSPYFRHVRWKSGRLAKDRIRHASIQASSPVCPSIDVMLLSTSCCWSPVLRLLD